MKNYIFSRNFISYHIFAIYVDGASLGLPVACCWWGSFAIGRRSGRKVYKMHHHIKSAITIYLLFISNLFTIEYIRGKHQGLCSYVFAYMSSRHQGFMQSGLTLIPAWISNCMPGIACIIKCGVKLFIRSQTGTLKVWEWISNFNSYFTGHVFLGELLP